MDGLGVTQSVSGNVRNILVNLAQYDQDAPTAQNAPIAQDASTAQASHTNHNTQPFEEASNIELFLHSIGHRRVAGINTSENQRRLLRKIKPSCNKKHQLYYLSAELFSQG